MAVDGGEKPDLWNSVGFLLGYCSELPDMAPADYQEAAQLASMMPPAPPPPVTCWWPLFAEDGSVAGLSTVSPAQWGRMATAAILAPNMARLLGVQPLPVFQCIGNMPPALWSLLDTPQGIEPLFAYVRESLGIPASPAFMRVQP